MNHNARQTQIANFILEKGEISVQNVVDMFHVSAATARRDLDQLAKQQFVVRTHGGATMAPSTGELPLRYRTTGMSAEKTRIAQAVAQSLNPGDSIALNGGTTTTEIAHEIGTLVSADTRFTRSSLTVITNAVNIAYELCVRDQVQVVLTGGVAQPHSYELTGPLTSLVLPAIDIHAVFFGLDAVSVERGALTSSDDEAAIGNLFIQAASKVVAVADHTKFSARSFARICPITAIDQIITDNDLDQTTAQTIRDAGVDLVLV